jgi:hypothetical protein
MTIRNKNKDHLKDHGGVELVVPALAPTSSDPLRFWTGHPTENTLVDLHEFANGLSESPEKLPMAPFSGRPEFIAELAPAIQAQLTLASARTCANYKSALRKFWRLCDQVEATTALDGRTLDRLTSVQDLTHLHEAAMHGASFDRSRFSALVSLFNNTRRFRQVGPLLWTTPKGGEPNRQLIPDSHAKALKIAIKRDWERVRRTWDRHDAIRRGEEPDTLTEYEKKDTAIIREYFEQNERLQKNWLHFERIQKSTWTLNPTGNQLYDGKVAKKTYRNRGISLSQMRAIAFPTLLEANIGFHAALIRSGWNPSTLITGIDATQPKSIFQHPKDANQLVLAVEAQEGEAQDNTEDLEEVTMQGSKRRAGGRLQFCMGLQKDPDSPPNIVAAYLARTTELRKQLHQYVNEANAEYERLLAVDAPKEDIELQFKKLQNLQQGTRNVWLYVDYRGDINWLDGLSWKFHRVPEALNARKTVSYLELLIDRLNVHCEKRGEEPITTVTPADFRDIYARWVHQITGGNILAVMLALGHASLKSTDVYVTNNIFNAENDETIRRFMTHLFAELEKGRVDLTILAQLVRHEPMTSEMHARLAEYRNLTRSRIKAGCADIKNPPTNIDPGHVEGKWCRTHRCLRDCPNARFLPESIDGIAMRVEELMVMSENLPFDVWANGDFEKELEAGEYLLADLYDQDAANQARAHWREKIRSGKHVVHGVGLIHEQEAA